MPTFIFEMPLPIPTDLYGPDSPRDLLTWFLVMALIKAVLLRAETLFFLFAPSVEIENLLLSTAPSFSSSSCSLIENKVLFFPDLLKTLLEKKSEEILTLPLI